jgi:hypothetical protein
MAFTAQPSAADAGATITPAIQVRLRDSYGNATSATNTVSITITSGTGTAGAALSGTVQKSAVAGVATFDNLSVDKAGSAYTLTASGLGLTSATSSSFQVRAVVPPPGPVATVDVTPLGAGVVVGDTVTLTAVAYDASNTVVPGQTVTWDTPASATYSFAPNGDKGLFTALARGYTGEINATIGDITGPHRGGITVYSPALMDSVSFAAAGWTQTTLAVGATKCTSLWTFDPNNISGAMRWVAGTSDATVIEVTQQAGVLSEVYCFKALKAGTANVTGTFAGKTATKTLTIP